jgi:sorbose reductase
LLKFLAEAGASIAVLDIIETSEGLFQIRKDHGVKLEYYKPNVTSRDEVMSRSREIEKEFATIDIK